jgi:hypothetical protein
MKRGNVYVKRHVILYFIPNKTKLTAERRHTKRSSADRGGMYWPMQHRHSSCFSPHVLFCRLFAISQFSPILHLEQFWCGAAARHPFCQISSSSLCKQRFYGTKAANMGFFETKRGDKNVFVYFNHVLL